MREEIIEYTHSYTPYFVSESIVGTCYLMHNKILVEMNGNFQSVPLREFFTEVYLLTPTTLLLVKENSFGHIEEIFSFEFLVMNIHTQETLASRKFKMCDFRGLKVKASEISVALNRYSESLMANFDPEGLNTIPPCSDHATCAEVISLDFDLNKLSEVLYENDLPDDLVIHLGGLDENNEIIFNSSTLQGQDKILKRVGDVVYLLREQRLILKMDQDGNTKLIYESEKPVVGIGMSLKNSLPDFRLYLCEHRIDLSYPNSLRYILEE